MADHVGKVLGPGPWILVDQGRIETFARASQDDHWMHTDPVRAAGTPSGTTIAQGFLTLAMIPALTRDMWSVRTRGGSYNYAVEGVRFVSPVPVGSRIRARLEIAGVERRDGATRIRSHHIVEREGQERPALIADTIIHIIDAERGWNTPIAPKEDTA
ncbi:MAG: MaoC family dehydratase [Pseudomonadota bacterium]